MELVSKCWNYRIALKFHRQLDNSATDGPVHPVHVLSEGTTPRVCVHVCVGPVFDRVPLAEDNLIEMPMPPKHVPQSRCSPVPMSPQPAHQSLCSPFLVFWDTIITIMIEDIWATLPKWVPPQIQKWPSPIFTKMHRRIHCCTNSIYSKYRYSMNGHIGENELWKVSWASVWRLLGVIEYIDDLILSVYVVQRLSF